MKKNKFVHLHVHTEYSLLDGLSKTKDLLKYVKSMGMDSLAITDHGVMYGAVEFYKNAKAIGIKPIIGIEAYTTLGDYTKKPAKGKFKNYHLILLSKNEEGYRNLMRLTSTAHLKGYYYKPRVDKKIIKKYSKGVICSSGCAQGEVAQALIENDYRKAKKVADWFLNVFKNDYYLEIQRHKYKEYIQGIENRSLRDKISRMGDNEEKINKGIIRLSKELGIPIIATNDAHYIRKEDATAQDALICIATGKNVNDIERMRFIDTPSFYITSPDEMAEIFSDVPESLENTYKVARKCNLTISTLGKWYFPKFSLPKKKSNEEYLRELVYKRLPDEIEKVDKDVKKRIEYELNIIIKKGYASYFLIVTDMVNWANNEGIITNTRGSAAGSLVSYVLGITTVNPLTYYLPFERFLNIHRPTPPDIDIDIADDKREKLINYISEKYGKDKVAQICTFGRMLSRAAVRDIARILGYPYAKGDEVAKLIPPPKQGFPITIPRALKETPQLMELYDNDVEVKKILDLAQQIEGNARHISVHAAGLVVAPKDITEFTPIQREPSGDKIITQYEFHACENVGLIKFDILGIRNLSILGSAVELAEKNTGKKIDLKNIPLDDKKTFRMLGRGETMGTFQLSSSGMTKYLKDLKPERIEDLMAMVALYRPGPIAVIPEYIKRKRNPKLIKYLDPRMEKFLAASYGLIVYQDDLLFCAIELAGYSWEEADKFRKAVGKKIPEEMAAQKEKFIKGVIKNGQTKKFADNLWKLFEPFQSYGFNKAHAASYGMVAYQTAYMKANYPVEFMTALLTAESSDKDKVSQAVNECKRMKINVLPPDINESDEGFKIVEDRKSLNGKAIRFGLDAIKNVGDAAISAIVSVRKKGSFVSFADFLKRVDARKVNKRVLESLIKVGALSNFGSRKYLLSEIDEIRKKVLRFKENSKQRGLFKPEDMRKKMSGGTTEENNSPSEFDEEELGKLEKELLGLSLSSKPISEILGQLTGVANKRIVEINEDLEDSDVTIAGIIKDIRIIVTRRSGQEMAFVKIEDASGIIDIVVFPSIFSESRSYLIDEKPILVSGKVNLRDDDISIIAEEIKAESEAKEGVVSIKIPKDVNMENLKELKLFLSKNRGDNKAVLVFERTDEKINLSFGIKWNETIAKKISAILEGGY